MTKNTRSAVPNMKDAKLTRRLFLISSSVSIKKIAANIPIYAIDPYLKKTAYICNLTRVVPEYTRVIPVYDYLLNSAPKFHILQFELADANKMRLAPKISVCRNE
jgi:hypothetical protein